MAAEDVVGVEVVVAASVQLVSLVAHINHNDANLAINIIGFGYLDYSVIKTK